MAKIDKYRDYIERILTEFSNYKSINEEVEAQTIFDRQRDHYQLVHVGWRNKRRIYGCVLHVDIKDNKIWIQHDGTEIGIAGEIRPLAKIFLVIMRDWVKISSIVY